MRAPKKSNGGIVLPPFQIDVGGRAYQGTTPTTWLNFYTPCKSQLQNAWPVSPTSYEEDPMIMIHLLSHMMIFIRMSKYSKNVHHTDSSQGAVEFFFINGVHQSCQCCHGNDCFYSRRVGKVHSQLLSLRRQKYRRSSYNQFSSNYQNHQNHTYS